MNMIFVRSIFGGVIAAFFSIILVAFVFPPNYQAEDTSIWPEEARAILTENYPDGAVTEDQFRRLNLLNKDLNFKKSFYQIFWMDVWDRWWIFLIVPIFFGLFFSIYENHGYRSIMWLGLGFPSVIVIAVAYFQI